MMEHNAEEYGAEELTPEQSAAMRETVREQTAAPNRREKNHVRLSKIWQTTQNIRSIQKELVMGYSFDKERMTEMVNAMFSFINGIVGPEQTEKASEVKVEEIVETEEAES